MPAEIIKEGSEIWIPSAETVWEEATALAVNGNLLTIKNSKGTIVQIDSTTTPAYLRNPTIAADVTALHYIHEPGILYCLEQRSAISEPYTLLGSVLVAVNPLMRIPDPPNMIGSKKANGIAHQFGIAEMAFAQMVFAEGRKAGKKGEEEIISNQSVVIGGESGAGKTESAKNVLRHLVKRNENAGGTSNLDDRLLSSNPILEAFGNASTMRNHNSSRFGKFLKLHFLETKRPGDTALWRIAGASVVTYLLERSRITTHNVGERGYHIFYQLRDGAPPDLRTKLGLDQTSEYRYMTARGEAMKMIGTKLKMDDKKEYVETDHAFSKLGLSDEIKSSLFQALAGVLHLGNIEFDNKETSQGNIAEVSPKGYGALNWAAKMFALDPNALSLMLRETEVKAGTEFIMKKRDGPAAAFARDAVAKAAFSNLFDWIVDMVNESLILEKDKDMNQLPFIGVLDIFGFESFDKNDFEQLLINYTNESLQGTFNRQVFVAEIELYKREGLMTGNDSMAAPPDNSVCMELLAGKGKVNGLLKVIDQECQAPQANDEKMNKTLAKTFEKNTCFVKPHPKDAATVFIIKHYAGVVTYTVGRFIEKNADKVPKEVALTFSKSPLPLIANLFKVDTGGGKAFGGQSILGKFTNQVAALIETLESSRDSFIRCVKPSPAMIRAPEMGISWFDRKYVTQQLKCLSVPQTAEVLKSGLPTRVPYEVLTENYMTVLPDEAISMWKRLGGGDLKSFMSALFYAFEVPKESYRTGVTRVFFKSGELALLDKIMDSANKWVEQPNDPQTVADKAAVVKRFKFFYARAVWRKVIVRQLIVDRFCGIIEQARARVHAANKLQSLSKMIKLRRRFQLLRKGALTTQRMWRGKLGRRRAAAKRIELGAELQRRMELARQREAEMKARAAEEARKAEEERLAAEKSLAESNDVERQKAKALLEELARQEEERRRLAEIEAEKLRQETIRLEAQKAEEARLAQLRKEKEEREAEELRLRLEAEEKERQRQLALKRAEDERKMAQAGGGKNVMQRKRVKKPSVVGLTQAQKTAAIKEAEQRILDERARFVAEGHRGYLSKQEKAGLFGGKKWKRLFFVLNVNRHELFYYASGDASNNPVGRQLGRWQFTLGKIKLTPVPPGKDKLFVLNLSDPVGGNFAVAAETDEERNKWISAIKLVSEGFKPSAEAEKAVAAAKALVIVRAVHNGEEEFERDEVGRADARRTDHHDKVGWGGGNGCCASRLTARKFDAIDLFSFPTKARDVLNKITVMLEAGLLNKDDADVLRQAVLAQVREMTVAKNEEGYSALQTQVGEQAAKAGESNAVEVEKTTSLVVCDVCAITNTHKGSSCQVCGAKLPGRTVDVSKAEDKDADNGFGPLDDRWLCQLPYKAQGTTFKCFIKEVIVVMDQNTLSNTPVYVLGCEITRGSTRDQWTVHHSWKWWEKWQQKMVDLGTFRVSDFPQVSARDSSSTVPETMEKLKDLLKVFLSEVLVNIKPSEAVAFFNNDLVDKAFLLKDNVREEMDEQIFAQAYAGVAKSSIASSDVKLPVNLEEMGVIDEAATLLIMLLKGDSRTVDLNDERAQKLRAICVVGLLRLRCSTDKDDTKVIRELISQAQSVTEHVEAALRVFVDTEIVQSA